MSRHLRFPGLLCISTLLPCVAAPDDPDLTEATRDVHARFEGRKGTFAQFGDSITVTMAFWAPLQNERRNAPLEMEDAFRRVKDRLAPECWRGWKGPSFGSEGGKTVRWARDNVDGWLKKLDPEVALIMFGTNDLHQLEVGEYRTKMGEVVDRCLKNGTVTILSTIAPRSGFAKKSEEFAEAVRSLAREKKVPLVDYHAEIIRRRPADWDGSSEAFKEWKDYEVPTLIARDGVHPSYPGRYQGDYSPEALRSSGYSLRNFIVLLKYAEVVQVLDSVPDPKRAWLPKPGPFKFREGETVEVKTAAELLDAAARLKPGGTILLADGRYPLPRRLDLKTDRATLRSASGNREAVVLDGGPAGLGELVAITGAEDVTIADLTIENSKWNGFKIDSETGVQRLTIHNCIIRNVWQRGVKGVKVPEADRDRLRPSACRVQYCLFENDRQKRFSDDPTDNAKTFGGDYIGGIDVMYARGWTIRGNVFRGIQGRTRQGRGAVFIWHESEDCVVEGNVIIDCDSGICLGNSSKPADVRIHASRCIVRNNFVVRAPENGILADHTEDCRIVHNTVHDPESRLGRLIRIVHDSKGLLVANNILSGPPVRNESLLAEGIRSNIAGEFTEWFAEAAAGDLHLRAGSNGAIDRAEPLDDVPEDIDGERRSGKPDLGADEVAADR